MLAGYTVWLTLALTGGGMGVLPRDRSGQDAVTSVSEYTYADYNFGFEIRLPGGWTYDRARFPGAHGSIGVLRAREPSGNQTITIEIYRSSTAMTFPEWAQWYEKLLASEAGIARIEVRTLNQERGDCLFETSGSAGGLPVLRWHVCVPFDRRTTWVLTLLAFGEGDDVRQAGRSAAERAHASLNVLYSPADESRLAESLARGAALMPRIARAGSALEVQPQTRFYEVRTGGRATGYIACRAQREQREGKAGLRTREEAWEFGEGGRARRVVTNAFASFDLRTEIIETRTDYVGPDEAGKVTVLTTLDQCVREGDMLFSSYSRSDQPTLRDAPPPIDTGPAYLPRAWVRFLPALLGAEATEPHAFAVYDTQIRGLVVHVVRLADAAQPTTAPGAGGDAATATAPTGGAAAGRRYEVREGYATSALLMETDARGELIRSRAGDVELELRSEAYVEETFGPQRDAARVHLPG